MKRAVKCKRCHEGEEVFTSGSLVGLCQHCIENDVIGAHAERDMVQQQLDSLVGLCQRCIENDVIGAHAERDVVQRQLDSLANATSADRVRPHTLRGWWQVWSGEICIALLRPEDANVIRRNGGDA